MGHDCDGDYGCAACTHVVFMSTKNNINMDDIKPLPCLPF